MQMKADVILADLGQRVAELERKLDIVTELETRIEQLEELVAEQRQLDSLNALADIDINEITDLVDRWMMLRAELMIWKIALVT